MPCGTTTFHPSTAAWSHVCMWPHRSAVTKQQISSNMFSLVDGQAAACAHKHQTVVYTLPCPETRLVGSKLKLAPYTALMLDITYTNAPISDITISGALPCCALLCLLHGLVQYALPCKSRIILWFCSIGRFKCLRKVACL